jgi:hypothetical protein
MQRLLRKAGSDATDTAPRADPHRPHQSLGQRSPDDDPQVPAQLIDLAGGRIERRPVLGGLVNEYEAA